MMLHKCLQNDKGGRLFLVVLIFMMMLLPLLNLLLPAEHIFHISTYTINILGKYLTYALLAIALDLVWGYLGILSLGHGAFFALGGYVMGMYLMRQIGDRGVYGNPNLPDFMVFLDWQELPWFWYGFDSFVFALLMVMIIPAILAYIFGYFTFKSRVTGVYLSIITQAMVYALMLLFFRNELGFGGNNGLTDFKDILGFPLKEDSTKIALFMISACCLLIGYIVARLIVNSNLGKIVIGIRDSEARLRFLGYKTENYKLFVFVISAIMAGIAGALYVPQVGIINPSEFSPLNSIEIVIWVAVGGRFTLYGGAIGAIIVNYTKTFFTTAIPEVWLFILGGLFVIITIYLPKGMIQIIDYIRDYMRQRKSPKSSISTGLK